MCFIGTGEAVTYRFAHRGSGTDAANPTGETIRLGVFDKDAKPLPFLFNQISPTTDVYLDFTSPRDAWTYYPPRVEGTAYPLPYTPAILHRALTANYIGPAGIQKLGFTGVNTDILGHFIDSVYMGLKPAIDFGPSGIVQQTGGNKLYLPIRVNGVLPVSETGAGESLTIFLKDTGTIPRDKYTLDQPRWGSADWFSGSQGGNPITVSWSEANKGWKIVLGGKARRIFDGDDADLYLYIPVTLKEYGDWKISFELAKLGEFNSSNATKWIPGGTTEINPVCEGDSKISIELKPNRSTDQWYSRRK